jgi:hypothetical protein
VAPRLAPWLETEPAIVVPAAAGDAVVIHNHRLLHGRRGFADPERAFVRVLIWCREAWPAPAELRARAAAARERLAARLAEAPEWLHRRLGLAREPSASARHRLEVVLELLRGTPAGVLSTRERVAEPELYRWRDAVLSTGQAELARLEPEDEGQLERLLVPRGENPGQVAARTRA